MASLATDRDVIDQITDALTAKYTPETVKQWRYRGIAWPERGKVAVMAERQGLELPADFLTKRRVKGKARAA